MIKMSDQFKEYYNTYPDDFKFLLKGIGNKFRFILSFYLLNRENASLSEIARYTNKKNSLVLNHISKLELGGIIQNFIEKREGTNEYSYYELTKLGKNVISNLFSNLDSFNEYFQKIKDNNFIEIIDIFPKEFELALKSINNISRFFLCHYLMENGPQTFSNITRITRKKKGLIAADIKKMELGGILQNYFQKSEEYKEYSFYAITRFGKTLISEILYSFNDYYNIGSEDTSYSEKDSIKPTESLYFECGSGTWALPNEKILGWINIFSKEIKRIEINISDNLRIDEFYNCELVLYESTKIYSLDIKENRFNYFSFEFHSKIPEENIHSTIEEIQIIAYNENSEQIENKFLKVEILKPVVNLKVQNKEIMPNKGYFQIEVSILKGFDIEIPGIEIKVTDKDGNNISIETQEKDLFEIEQDLPPGLKLDNLIGKFIMHNKGIFHFHFRIPFIDANNNKYFSNEEVIELKNIDEFHADLDYIYNYSSEIAIT